MTVGELKEKLQDIPDDFVVTCTMDESFSPDDARVYEATDAFAWKSWGLDELRILHSDDTIF